MGTADGDGQPMSRWGRADGTSRWGQAGSSLSCGRQQNSAVQADGDRRDRAGIVRGIVRDSLNRVTKFCVLRLPAK